MSSKTYGCEEVLTANLALSQKPGGQAYGLSTASAYRLGWVALPDTRSPIVAAASRPSAHRLSLVGIPGSRQCQPLVAIRLAQWLRRCPCWNRSLSSFPHLLPHPSTQNIGNLHQDCPRCLNTMPCPRGLLVCLVAVLLTVSWKQGPSNGSVLVCPLIRATLRSEAACCTPWSASTSVPYLHPTLHRSRLRPLLGHRHTYHQSPQRAWSLFYHPLTSPCLVVLGALAEAAGLAEPIFRPSEFLLRDLLALLTGPWQTQTDLQLLPFKLSRPLLPLHLTFSLVFFTPVLDLV